MPLRVATLAGDLGRETTIAAAVSRCPALELVLRCVERPEALAAIRGGAVDVILAVGAPGWFDFQCVEEARREGISLAGLAADPVEVELLQVSGFTVLPADAEVSSLPELITQPDACEPPDVAPSPEGKVVAVWGPKGAPGRSSIALELAEALALSETSTLLADVDLYGGDLLQLAGVIEELPGIIPLARCGAKGELRDPSWIGRLRRPHPSGPVLLPGLLRAHLWDEVSHFGFEQLQRAAQTRFRYSVWDVGFCLEPGRVGDPVSAARNAVARTTVAAADQVVAVFRADPVGIKNFLWSLTDVTDLLDEQDLLLIANRVRPGEEDEVKALIRRHLGRPPFALVPDRPDLFARASWEGRSVLRDHPASGVSEELLRVAAALGGAVPARGFLSRLVGRGSRG